MTMPGGVILAKNEQIVLETQAEVKTFTVTQVVILRLIKKESWEMDCYTLQLIDCYFWHTQHRCLQCLVKISVQCCYLQNL